MAAFAGIDWADDHHDVALQLSGSDQVEHLRLDHTPEAISRWLSELQKRCAAGETGGKIGGKIGKIGIAIETSRGGLIHALLEVPFVIIYPVNPRALRRFREAFYPSGAKDDKPDARLLLELLVKHRHMLKPLVPDDVPTRTLERLTGFRRKAVDERTKLTQQLLATLKEYYPQAIAWAGGDLSSPMACRFLEKWPTFDSLKRSRPETIRHFYTKHGSRSTKRIEERLQEIGKATPLTTDRAIVESSSLMVRLLARQILTLNESIKKLEKEIESRFSEHPDAFIFESFPQAGAALAPRLLVAMGSDRSRFSSASEVQTRVGIAPITKRSGRQSHVERRWATSVFPKQSFHEYAQCSLRSSPWARAYYYEQRKRGKSHHTAIRALAFKWIRIIYRCWQERTPYDEARYLAALERRGSPLSTRLTITDKATENSEHVVAA
jgi:transposase